MAQPFSLRYMLVDGQGQLWFYRWRLRGLHALYRSSYGENCSRAFWLTLIRETVDYSTELRWYWTNPSSSSAKFLTYWWTVLLWYRSDMATNIPHHNLGEVVDGCLALINNEEITIDEPNGLRSWSDFPTAALISGRKGIVVHTRTTIW